MSLSAACSHAWLADVPTLSHLQPRAITDSVASIQDGTSCASSLDEDAEMTDGSSEPTVTEGLDKLHLRQQSARVPLHQETANGVRNGKRKLDPQSPLPDVDVENGIPKKPKRVPEANGPTTRTRAAKGRGRGGASSPLARLQEAAAGMVVEEEHLDDEEDVEEAAGAASHAPPRKSTRVSPKRGGRRG